VARRSREVAARVQFIGFPHPRCDILPHERAEEAEVAETDFNAELVEHAETVSNVSAPLRSPGDQNDSSRPIRAVRGSAG
jgi:hypothetical protein